MRSVRIQILAFVLLGALFFSIPLSVTAEDAAFSYVSNVWACYKSFCEQNGYSYIIEQSIKSTYHEEEIISSDYIIEAHTSYSINILLPIRIVRRLLFAPNGRRQVIPGFGVLLFSVLLLR